MKTKNITFIKTSSEDLINDYVDAFFYKLINKNRDQFSISKNPITYTIGIRVIK